MSALPAHPEAAAPAADPIPTPASRWTAAVASAAAVVFSACVPASIAGEQLAWGVVLLALLGLTLQRRPGLARSPVDGPLVLHAATVILSLVFTSVRGYSAIEAFDFWRLLAVVAVTSAFVRDRAAARRGLVALLGVTGAVSVYAIVQRFTGVDLLRHGTAVVLPRSGVTPGRYRVSGLFNAYSTLSMVWVTTLAFFAAAAVELVRGGWRRTLVAAAAAPALVALAFTEVRAAWIGLLAGLAAAALARSRRAFALAVAWGAVVLTVLVLAMPAVRAKAATTFHLDYSHNRDRVFMWAHSLEMAGDAPATGVGNGHYVAATGWYFDRWDAAFPMRTHAHNTVIHWWATTGALGLAAFLWLFVAFFMATVPAYRRARAAGDRLGAALGFGAIAAVAGILATGVGQTPWFDGEVFYGLVFAFAAGLAVVAWTREAPLPRPTLAGVAGVAVPAGLGILVGFTQGRWDPSLGAGGFFTGAGSSIRVGALFALAGAGFFVGIFPSLRRRLRADGFTWSLLLAAVTALGAWILVARVLAPAAGVPQAAGPWIPASALTILAVALAFRVLFLSPFGWPGIAGVALVAVAAGAMTHGIEAPPVHLLPWKQSGPVVVGHDDRVPVSALSPQDPRRIAAAAVVSYGAPLSGRRCWATVLGGRSVLTTDRCGSVLLGRVTVGKGTVRCLRAVDRVPGADLAAVRCRAAGPGRDLVDLAGASRAIATRPPKAGQLLWRVTREQVTTCRVRRVDGPVILDDCDGSGPPGAPLVDPASGQVVAVDLGRAKDGRENRAALAARLLAGRDRDHDGIPDGVDDCLRYDPSQLDSDRDGVGDACEPLLGAGRDGDGLVAYAANGATGRFRVRDLVSGPRLGPAAPPFPLENLHLAGLGGGRLGGLRWAGIGAGDLGPSARYALVNAWDGDLFLLDAAGRPGPRFDFGAGSHFVGLAVGRFQGAHRPEAVALARNLDHRVIVMAARGRVLKSVGYLVDPHRRSVPDPRGGRPRRRRPRRAADRPGRQRGAAHDCRLHPETWPPPAPPPLPGPRGRRRHLPGAGRGRRPHGGRGPRRRRSRSPGPGTGRQRGRGPGPQDGGGAPPRGRPVAHLRRRRVPGRLPEARPGRRPAEGHRAAVGPGAPRVVAAVTGRRNSPRIPSAPAAATARAGPRPPRATRSSTRSR